MAGGLRGTSKASPAGPSATIGTPRAISARETASLYDKLEYVILPMFYGRPTAFARVMRSAIAINASFFNAQRMMLQYLENAYRLFG